MSTAEKKKEVKMTLTSFIAKTLSQRNNIICKILHKMLIFCKYALAHKYEYQKVDPFDRKVT